jgi:hypothetical protein
MWPSRQAMAEWVLSQRRFPTQAERPYAGEPPVSECVVTGANESCLTAGLNVMPCP